MSLIALGRPAALALSLLLPSVVLAQTDTEPTRIRGTVDSLEGSTLTVTTREGETAVIALDEGWNPVGVTTASLDDITEGSYVGVASAQMADGREGALEVLIFPEAMAGAGEGRFPWDLQPDSMMTNAAVASVGSVDGTVLTLTHGGEDTEIVVPPEAPIVTFGPATEADIAPGATVFVPGQKAADGTLSTATVVVETGGVLPPM